MSPPSAPDVGAVTLAPGRHSLALVAGGRGELAYILAISVALRRSAGARDPVCVDGRREQLAHRSPTVRGRNGASASRPAAAARRCSTASTNAAPSRLTTRAHPSPLARLSARRRRIRDRDLRVLGAPRAARSRRLRRDDDRLQHGCVPRARTADDARGRGVARGRARPPPPRRSALRSQAAPRAGTRVPPAPARATARCAPSTTARSPRACCATPRASRPT